MRPIICALLVFSSALLSSCSVNNIPQKGFDPANKDRIRRIAILTPGIDEKMSVVVYRPVIEGLAAALGPVASLGAGIAFVTQNVTRSSKFTESAHGNGLHHIEYFASELTTALTSKHYSVSDMAVERKPRRKKFLETYPAHDGTVDAYLDIYAPQLGLASAGTNLPFRPHVALHVRFVKADDKTHLFQDAIVFNPFGSGFTGATIPHTGKYEFDTYSDIESDIPKAVAGMKHALTAVSQRIATEIN